MSNIDNLPWIIFYIDMTLNDKQMLYKMMEIFEQMNAPVIESTQNSFIVIKNNNLIQNIFSFFFCSNKNNPKIKVIIHFIKNQYNRIVEMQSLQGFQIENETLIINYLKKCIPIIKKIKILDSSKGNFLTLEDELQKGFMEYIEKEATNIRSSNIISIIDINKINKNNKNRTKRMNDSIDNSRSNFLVESSDMVEKINKHASNYYEIYKILSQNKYDIGRIMTSFINEFKIKNEHVEKNYMRLPEQMKEIIKIRNICDETFSNYFNMGKSFRLNDELPKQAKTAIDNFIFNKLYFLLYELYNRKYKEENEEFLKKKKMIKEIYTIEGIMNYLEIKPQFRCLEAYENSGHSSLCIPFRSTIDNLNKLEFEQNPHIKFNTLIEAGLELRNTALGNNNGRNDINSMDDELPIFIYCSTQINTKNAFAEYHMIKDYINYSSKNLVESKVLANFYSSILFISKEWDIKKAKI